MKKILALLVALMIMLPVACASYESYYYDAVTPQNYAGARRIVNCDEWVSLREHPSTTAARLAKVPLGDTVLTYYYPETLDFTLCEYNGIVGFILNEYIGSDLLPSTTTIYSGYIHEDRAGKWMNPNNYLGTMEVAHCNEWVSLRSDPSTEAPRIAEVWLGETVEAFHYYPSSDFLLCDYNGMIGFILMDYLEPTGYALYYDSYDSYDSYDYSPSYMTEDRPGKWMNDSNYLGCMYVVNCDEWVSLREHPSTQSDRLAKVWLYDMVEAYYYSPNPDFLLCDYAGEIGFILAEYLSY